MSGVSKIMDSEVEIMKVLWEQSPLSANEVYSILSKKKEWSKSTIITLMNRLVEKGAVCSEKKGVYLYSPIVSEEEYKNYHAETFLKKMFNGSAKNLLAYFCDTKDITVADLDELKQLIERRE